MKGLCLNATGHTGFDPDMRTAVSGERTHARVATGARAHMQWTGCGCEDGLLLCVLERSRAELVSAVATAFKAVMLCAKRTQQLARAPCAEAAEAELRDTTVRGRRLVPAVATACKAV